jgi:GNAT superfamily N-acetyltransferase
MDRTITHISVMMENRNARVYPRYDLPAGYVFTTDKRDLKTDWIAIQLASDHVETPERAAEVYDKEFGSQPEAYTRQTALAVTLGGQPVGVATLWPGNEFGRILYKVHWVAVDAAHQGKSIAKALMTRLFDINRELINADYLYLTTQTWSYRAINIYKQFGFEPYLGERPINWKEEMEDYEAKQVEAWEISDEMIGRYKS